MPAIMMNILLTVFLMLFFQLPLTYGRDKLLVKEIKSGKIRHLKSGKIIGVISKSDTLNYHDQYNISVITDSSIIVNSLLGNHKIEFLLSDIKVITFRINESDSAPVAMGFGGALIVVISPFSGIEKGGYNFETAGLTFGVGAGLVGLTYLATRGRKLKDYQIIGIKK
jgi:hypothetical protein